MTDLEQFEVLKHNNTIMEFEERAMNEDQAENGYEGVHMTSTKKKQLDEMENLENEDPHMPPDRTMSNRSEEKNSIMINLMRMNDELKYLHCPSFTNLEGCSIHHLHEVYRIVDGLLISKSDDNQRFKEVQSRLYRAELENNKLVSKTEILVERGKHSQIEKEEMSEKVKQIAREYKIKEEKGIKERESFLKEKRAAETREHAIKTEFRKRDETISTLNNKLRKIQEKNEKPETRVSFDLIEPLLKKHSENGHSSLLERECDALAMKAIKEKEEYLDNQNRMLKNYLGQILDRLDRIGLNNPEEAGYRDEHTRYRAMLEMPFERATAFIEKMKELMTTIEEMITKKEDGFQILSAGKSAESSNLVYSIEKMKYYYKNAQDLEQQRSKFSEDLFGILQRKQKLNLPTLQKLSYSINASKVETEIEMADDEVFDLQKEREFFKQEDKRFQANYEFVHQQIDFMKKRACLIGTMHRTIGQVGEGEQGGEEDNLNLI